MIGIYKIVNPKGRVYIGESTHIEKRWQQYKNGHCNKQWKLYNSIQKYGWEAHKVEVLEECTIASLRERERYWQLLHNSIAQGLNLKLTGVGELKTEDSLGVSLNRSKGQTGRRHTQETKNKLSLIRKGKPKPEGFGASIRLAKTGTNLTEQHKNNIRKSHQKACMVDGVQYSSCKEAAAVLGIPERTLQHRLHSKNYKNCCYI
jgi:group I intron endonuclease